MEFAKEWRAGGEYGIGRGGDCGLVGSVFTHKLKVTCTIEYSI